MTNYVCMYEVRVLTLDFSIFCLITTQCKQCILGDRILSEMYSTETTQTKKTTNVISTCQINFVLFKCIQNIGKY